MDEQRPDRRLHVFGAHQGLADQEAVDAGAGHAGQVGRRVESALADENAPGRHHGGQPFRGRQIHLEGPQVPVVDADEPGVQAERPIQFRLVVDLDEDIHAELLRRVHKFHRPAVVHRRHDEQNTVGAEDPRLDDLVGIQHEILAQDRQDDRRPGRHQVFVGTLEVGYVGEHGEAGGAPGLEGLGQGNRCEVGADHALGRRSPLDLGDQSVSRGAGLGQARSEAAWRRRLVGGLGDDAEGPAGFAAGDVFEFVGADAGEDVAHEPASSPGAPELVMAISLSRVVRAAPPSMAAAARPTPSWSVRALPATTRAPALL